MLYSYIEVWIVTTKIFGGTQIIKKNNNHIEELQITHEDTEAVSYTHLDVYKRQTHPYVNVGIAIVL